MSYSFAHQALFDPNVYPRSAPFGGSMREREFCINSKWKDTGMQKGIFRRCAGMPDGVIQNGTE